MGVTMPLAKEQTPNATPGTMALTTDPAHVAGANATFGYASGSRDLTGYNVYRSTEGGEYELIGFTEATTYTDADLPNALYCYMVSAVWTSETDYCESDWIGEVCEIMSVGIGEPGSGAYSFNLYPNPADDHVFITTSQELKRVTVYNALGQLISDELVTGQQYELTTSSYTIGIYMVRVETAGGVTTRTLTIQR
jgi:hypothetical protein